MDERKFCMDEMIPTLTRAITRHSVRAMTAFEYELEWKCSLHPAVQCPTTGTTSRFFWHWLVCRQLRPF
jgi:hypothetical protein